MTHELEINYCESCGFRLPDQENFCSECGARVKEAMPHFNEAQKVIWDEFLARQQVVNLGKPVFETDKDLITVHTYDKNGRNILDLSQEIRQGFKTEIDLLKKDFENDNQEYDGLIYMLYYNKDDSAVPLYIGIAEKIGKSGGLSSTLKSNNSTSRWGDADKQYHIGGLSTVVCNGYQPEDIYAPKRPWAERLFRNFPSDNPQLCVPTYLFVKAWRGSDVGCWKGFGATPLPFLESCLIAVAGSLFPNLLLNIQGVTRKTD